MVSKVSNVSVIITTHSRPRLLPRAVASALASGTDVEVIVVDDASTDETADVCKKLDGISYIRLDKNQGTSRARNIGIEASSGEHISFHDDDDRKLPGSVDELSKLLDENPTAGLVYGQAWAGDGNLDPVGDPFPAEVIQGDVFWRLVEANFIPTIGAVFRKSCLSEVGMIDPSLTGVDDYDLWIRISERYDVLGLQKPVGVWRTSSARSSQGSSDRVLEAIRCNYVSNRALNTLERPHQDKQRRRAAALSIKKRTSDFLFWNAGQEMERGDASSARESLRAGLRLNAGRIIRPTVLRLSARSFLGR